MGSPKFLVVDDSVTMRRIIINALRAIGYDNLIEAEDGQDALQKLLDKGADFVIADWNMPEMTGLELASWIRGNGFFSRLPILMITTRGSKDDVLKARGAEINDYILKPFSPQSLKEKIDKILKSTEPKNA
ncbi:MAG: response regulator [Ignavibacteria bacterium]|nr:response regulator [Ignavibacteria bacterium]